MLTVLSIRSGYDTSGGLWNENKQIFNHGNLPELTGQAGTRKQEVRLSDSRQTNWRTGKNLGIERLKNF